MANTLKKNHQQIHLRIGTVAKLKEVCFKRIVATQNPKQTADDGVNFLIEFWNQHKPKEETLTA